MSDKIQTSNDENISFQSIKFYPRNSSLMGKRSYHSVRNSNDNNTSISYIDFINNNANINNNKRNNNKRR